MWYQLVIWRGSEITEEWYETKARADAARTRAAGDTNVTATSVMPADEAIDLP